MASLEEAAQDGVVRYESLDCVREHESWRMRADIPLLALGMSNSPALRVKRRTALVWMVAFIIGVATAAIALVIAAAISNLSGLRLFLIFEAMDHGLPTFHTFVCYTCLNMFFVLLATCTVVYISPAAAGSGIADVKAYLNAVNRRETLSLRTFFAKVFGIIFAVSGMLAVGKEGPLVHIGACIASAIGSRNGPLWWKGLKELRYFRNDKDRIDLVTLGAACGVAAAFKAPIGGLLFVVEEATSWWRAELMWRVFFCCTITAVVMDAGSRFCQGGDRYRCGYFNGGGLIMFQGNYSEGFNAGLLGASIVLGLLGGLAGAAFVSLNMRLCRFRERMIQRIPQRALLEGLLLSFLTSTIVFFLPVMVGQCKECVSGEQCPPGSPQFTRFVHWQCDKEHKYNDLMVLMVNPQDEAIRALFQAPSGSFGSLSLSFFMLYYFVLAIATYGIAVPGGLFIPSMLVGATGGRLYCHALEMMGILHSPNEGLWALLGAAAYMGGVMRLLPCLCVILIEITGSLSQLPIIMLVLIVSKTVGDCFNRSIYDEQIHMKQIPFLEPRLDRKDARRLVAGDVATRPLASFQQVEPVSRLRNMLQMNSHNAYPIVQPAAHGEVLVGLISRQKVKELVAATPSRPSESFQFAPSTRSPDRTPVPSESSTSEDDEAREGPSARRTRGLHWTQAEPSYPGDPCVDLRTHMHAAPYVVYNVTPVKMAYQLFRTMGLRHLTVVTPSGNPVGMLTRKSFLTQFHDQLERDYHAVFTNDSRWSMDPSGPLTIGNSMAAFIHRLQQSFSPGPSTNLGRSHSNAHQALLLSNLVDSPQGSLD